MLITLITMVFIVTLMIGFNAFYVAGEFAAVSARKTRIIQQANQGNPLAKMMLPVLEDHHKLDNYIAASQVGITISSVVLGIYGQQQIAPRIAPMLSDFTFIGEAAAAGIAATLVLILLTTLQVILGELVPKSVTLQYPERLALWTVIPMIWSADFILRPLIVLLNGSGTLILRLLDIESTEGHNRVHSPEEIKLLLYQSHQEGILGDQEHQLLDGALRFRTLCVGEIMKPRTKIVAAEVATPINEILRQAAETDFTRILIYEDDIDHVIGFVHLKELFQVSYRGDTIDARAILREVVFSPETVSLPDVWNALNEAKTFLAVVIDEYGGTAGLITREDLLEELFGEVLDEYDESEPASITKVGDNQYRVRGDVAISVLNDRFALNIVTGNMYTIGGYFLNQLGHIPELGEELVINNARLRAGVVVEKAVEEIILTLEQPDSNDEGVAS